MWILNALHRMINIWKVGPPVIFLKPNFLKKIVLSIYNEDLEKQYSEVSDMMQLKEDLF